MVKLIWANAEDRVKQNAIIVNEKILVKKFIVGVIFGVKEGCKSKENSRKS